MECVCQTRYWQQNGFLVCRYEEALSHIQYLYPSSLRHGEEKAGSGLERHPALWYSKGLAGKGV